MRVIRACRELGIRTVAVYSDVDRTALHVRMADEARWIGPAAASESYLSLERILDAARASGAEPIHPGYGFLSENPRLPEACEKAAVVFIGPSAASMELMGSKTRAREAMLAAGGPVIPGTTCPVSALEQARHDAARFGYPVLVKAAAGGGGKGMRAVERDEDLPVALREASSEAERSFGDGSVYLEKYLHAPRHIEIQVLGDRQGRLIHLGERECSLQRRHQKVVEECPSPLIAAHPEMRREMGETAVRAARAAGYYNVGTVEFLVDASRNFYFLEMNTRLQVEHPVTEMVTGIDLVREQIRIAAGEKLTIKQRDVRWEGSAIECRVYAEDPEHNFLPSPGRITRLRTPSGPGVRDDSGVYEGWDVPIFYDPMISKLATWGATRDEAISRMRRALGEYHVGGIRTTIPFFSSVLDDEEFRRGEIDTGYIARFLERQKSQINNDNNDDRIVAAIVAGISYTRQSRNQQSNPSAQSEPASKWKTAGRLAALKNR